MTTFLPLTLGVRPTSDAEQAAFKNRSKAKENNDKILRQDDFTCRFCGFRAEQYQRVIPYKKEQVTACSFCEQCLTLERSGMMGSGILVWLPEIGQAELNHIARAIYVARSEGGPAADLATRAFDALMARRTDAKKRLGSDDPLLLATVLHESLTPDEQRASAGKLGGIRLLPLDKHVVRSRQGDINHFPAIIKYWCSPNGPFAAFPADSWVEKFKGAAAVGQT